MNSSICLPVIGRRRYSTAISSVVLIAPHQYHHRRPRTPPNAAPETACQWRERGGRVMIGRLQRGAGAVAAAGMVLGLWLLAPASGAQATGAGHPRHGGHTAAAEWAGFAGNAQHMAVARTRPQPFHRIRWR